WLNRNVFTFDELPRVLAPARLAADELRCSQRAFGWTDEDVRQLVLPMAETGHEPVGSMGKDSPLAVLSDQAPSLFRYFHQLFAQAPNPPIAPHREALVMTLETAPGPDGNTLEETPAQCHRLTLPGPILTNGQLARLSSLHHEGMFFPRRLSALFDIEGGPDALEAAVERLCREAVEAGGHGWGLSRPA